MESEDLIYLNESALISINKRAIKLFEIKKKDKHELMSLYKLAHLVDGCIDFNGDFYEKTVFLTKSIIKSHCFASGNRRTALLALFLFHAFNNKKLYITDDPINNKIFLGIREGYYSDDELSCWIRSGKIKKFKR